ncbi:glycosyltransferase [Caulobacter sp.]|uniref:glycosyltransferase n=1 Tax=Caulobacter sp. TaxID=78 RepID=UPI003BA8AE9C
MTGALWLIATICFVLAIYPVTLYPLTLSFARKRIPNRTSPVDPRPTLAICMSAYMEERTIVSKIESLLAMAKLYGPARIYVYVDGSSDRTAELLESYRDRIELVVSEARSGKTAGLNRLVELSTEEMLTFTDANVNAPPDSLVTLLQRFTDPMVAAVSARLIFANNSESGTSGSTALYWDMEETVKRMESDTIGLVGVDGALFMIRRSAYVAAPNELIDDLYVSLMVTLNGGLVVSEGSVLVEERNASRWQEEFQRKRRIACQAINVHRTLWPRLRKLPTGQLYGYLAHRVLKWIAPFNIALSALLFWVGFALWVGFAPAMSLVMAGLAIVLALSAAGLRYARGVLSAVTSLIGVGLGVLDSVALGRTYTTWTPAPSIRV